MSWSPLTSGVFPELLLQGSQVQTLLRLREGVLVQLPYVKSHQL